MAFAKVDLPDPMVLSVSQSSAELHAQGCIVPLTCNAACHQHNGPRIPR